jgi:hypothetical protein
MRESEIKRRIRLLTTAGSLLGIMGLAVSGQVCGQDLQDQPDRAPVYYYAQDPATPDAAPAPPVDPGSGAACSSCNGCNGGCNNCCDSCNNGCAADHGWKLMDLFADGCGHNHLAECGYTFAGWVEMGYQSDFDGAFTGNGVVLDDVNERRRFNLNQSYLYAEKVADGADGLGFGYRADLMYGVDGNEAQSFGNNPGTFDFLNGWDHGIYEWAMPQLYAQVAYDRLSVKVGHFYTPTGYEVVPPAGNFFFSRQITWYHGEPFTHTGALATYTASDQWTFVGGWVLGWDTGFDQFNQGNMGVFGASYTASEDVTIAYFGAYGNSGWRGSRSDLSGLIVSLAWTENLRSIHQFDVFGSNNAEDPIAPGGNFAVDGVVGDDVAAVNYLIYDFNDQWSAGARQEWFKADGISYYTMTYGLNYKPLPNLLVRPEMRHLWTPGAPGGAPGTIAANVADVMNNDVFGVDVVWSF